MTQSKPVTHRSIGSNHARLVATVGALAMALTGACSSEPSSGGYPATGGAAGAAAAAGTGAIGGSGGAGATGGSGGSGATGGGTQGTAGKLDLLLMIDNSIRMGRKHAVLSDALPYLVTRLVDPVCVVRDASGNITDTQPGPGIGASCAQGERQFPPLTDIHIGVITSSLGGYGADLCADGQPGTPNDHGHLMGAERNLASYDGLGFLAWDPAGTKTPVGTSDPSALVSSFDDHLASAGGEGCGYEASLEAWYRFLVDPAPPASWMVVDGVGTPSTELDDVLLAQRASFLRPDSAVAIVMFTDENDCSINPRGQGWLTAQAMSPSGSFDPWYMPRGSSACEQNPNSPCCRPCASSEGTPPAGCAPLSQDTACLQGQYYTDRSDDHMNLRCWDHKRRFGIDFLYPTERYVNALTKPQLCSTRADLDPAQCNAADLAQNPLLGSLRQPNTVFLAGIVGVPWQLIATDATNEASEAGLEYLTSAELTAGGVWSAILGQRGDANTPPTPPSDPHMIETPDQRPGLPGPDSAVLADPIHGHEYLIPTRGDLQYACVAPLPVPEDCTGTGPSCDCSGDPSTTKSPLCQDPSTGAYGTTQHFAQGYPGGRHLQVLKDFGNNSIVASICPKSVAPTDPAYGYNPAMAAIADQLSVSLR